MSDESPLERLTAATGAVLAVYDHLVRCARNNGQTHLAEEIQRDRSRLAGGLRIAVVGAFSSGKSTFVNALIGRKVLPTRVEPTTATVTEVHNGPAGTASVRLKTEDEIQREQEEARKRREALESQADPDAREEEELRALESVARLDTDFQYPGGLPATFHLDRDADREAIERFLADGPDSWAPYAERVTLEMPMDERAVPARAIIVDTPGSNSLSRLHRNATWRALIEADCVIFLVTARAPFSAHDRELLSDVRRVRQENGLKQGLEHDRFLFVANAIDDVEEEERERVRDYLKARLIELGIEEPRVELASALVACLAQAWAAGEQLSKRERRLLMDSTDDEPLRGWETSGVARVMDRLWRTVGREAAQHLLDDALLRAGKTCDFLTEEVNDQFRTVNESEKEAKSAAEEAERLLARKRRHLNMIEREGQAVVRQTLAGFGDLSELRALLDDTVGSHARDRGLRTRVEAEVRYWLSRRLQEVEVQIQEAGSQIQDIVARCMDMGEGGAVLSLPRLPDLTFDVRFDLPDLVDPHGGGVAAPASIGAVVGGLIGGFLGGPVGAVLGAGLGGLIMGSAKAQAAKEWWESQIVRQKKLVRQSVDELQSPFDDYLRQIENRLVRWGVDRFEGRLADLHQRYVLRVKLAREAAGDAEVVRQGLNQQLDELARCGALREDAQQKVERLGQLP